MKIGTLFGEWNTNKPRFTKRGSDRDGDGVPNSFDCEPDNPRKQGVIHEYLKAKSKRVSAAIEGYRKYKAASEVQRAKREDYKIARLKRQAEIERHRTTVIKARAGRVRATPRMSYGAGAGTGFTGMFGGMGHTLQQPKPKVKSRKRRRRKKK